MSKRKRRAFFVKNSQTYSTRKIHKVPREFWNELQKANSNSIFARSVVNLDNWKQTIQPLTKELFFKDVTKAQTL